MKANSKQTKKNGMKCTLVIRSYGSMLRQLHTTTEKERCWFGFGFDIKNEGEEDSRRRETEEEVLGRKKKRESEAKSRCCRNSSWSSCHLGLQAWTLFFFEWLRRGPIAILGSSRRKMACWLYKRVN
jgi:hypothetical protein